MPTPPPITDPTPATHVDTLPESEGKGKTSRQEKIGAFDIKTNFETLTGTITVSTIKQDVVGAKVSLELTSEKGRVRAYLLDGKGYQYVEASPGSPARIRADAIYGGGYYLYVLQAVDGEASGVVTHVWRNK